eukprot:TRINITY_DN7894_c1_g1_i5.p1 TRINITY_DN7894_c1_g1~~TRINITY_DN7894_c1_g1_i5.p1  ORF type:complete len:703 (-),score=231.78 TRINITY_DN7894_c1_g1_i5:167-2275(-)
MGGGKGQQWGKGPKGGCKGDFQPPPPPPGQMGGQMGGKGDHKGGFKGKGPVDGNFGFDAGKGGKGFDMGKGDTMNFGKSGQMPPPPFGNPVSSKATMKSAGPPGGCGMMGPGAMGMPGTAPAPALGKGTLSAGQGMVPAPKLPGTMPGMPGTGKGAPLPGMPGMPGSGKGAFPPPGGAPPPPPPGTMPGMPGTGKGAPPPGMPGMMPMTGAVPGFSAKSSSLRPPMMASGPGAPPAYPPPPGGMPPMPPPAGMPPMAPVGPPGGAPPGGMMNVPQPPPGGGLMPPAPAPTLALPPMPPPAAQATPVRGLASDLQALVAAGAPGQDVGGGVATPFLLQPEKKPQLFMLVAQMAPHVTEHQIQQILEQCGEVQAFRRGKDGAGNPMSFGVAQFGDPEAAWKAFSCVNKRMVGGQEAKVLLEENTESLINKWKTAQKVVHRVQSDEDLEWELERTAVSCKALIDAKLEELFGPIDGDAKGGAVIQRRQELRERETARVDRAKKRKAWREAEFARELQKVELSEKSLREQERALDIADKNREETDTAEKAAREAKLEKLEADGGAGHVNVSGLVDNRALMDLVDKVQEEAREQIFTVRLKPEYLRNERVLERKLRPWLEKKIDLYMGGQTSDLVEHIIRRVNSATSPDPLIAELERFLDDNAEPLVETIWRMLSLEMTQDGLELPSAKRAKREKKEEIKEEKKGWG